VYIFCLKTEWERLIYYFLVVYCHVFFLMWYLHTYIVCVSYIKAY